MADIGAPDTSRVIVADDVRDIALMIGYTARLSPRPPSAGTGRCLAGAPSPDSTAARQQGGITRDRPAERRPDQPPPGRRCDLRHREPSSPTCTPGRATSLFPSSCPLAATACNLPWRCPTAPETLTAPSAWAGPCRCLGCAARPTRASPATTRRWTLSCCPVPRTWSRCPVWATAAVRYRPRSEAGYARITHVTGTGGDYWEVWSTDGLRSRYGTPRSASPALGLG